MDISMLSDFDYFKYQKQIDKIREAFPFVGRKLIGKSVMGKRIEALLLGSAEEYAVFVGGVHGRDSFTVGFLLAFFDELCRGLSEGGSIEGLNVARAISGRALMVIPCLNPDGCEISAKGKAGCLNRLSEIMQYSNGNLKEYSLNARGVDIDLDFTAYRGCREPESFALKEILKEAGVRQVVIFGSGNNEIISPQGAKIPSRSNRMTEIMAASTGYTVSANRNDRRREGFMQWFSAEYFKPAYKVLPKVPMGKISESQYIGIYKELRELMMLCAIM